MAVMSELEVSVIHPVLPEVLCEARQIVPLIRRDEGEGNYIAVGIDRQHWQPITPALDRLNDGAVNFSLGMPFGVMFSDNGHLSLDVTQLTDGIILSPGRALTIWQAGLSMDGPPTERDKELFECFLRRYVGFAVGALGSREVRW